MTGRDDVGDDGGAAPEDDAASMREDAVKAVERFDAVVDQALTEDDNQED